jgi:hypothetical protein
MIPFILFMGILSLCSCGSSSLHRHMLLVLIIGNIFFNAFICLRVQKTEITAVGIRCADNATPSIS